MMSFERIVIALSTVLVAAVDDTNGQTFNPFKFEHSSAPGLDAWFKDAKLGMFMHWGPVSQWGTEISFPLVCQSLPCTVQAKDHDEVVINTTEQLAAHRMAYANLSQTFNPINFNASDMASKAKAAGFKYLMYTTVHCDGFKNWNSKLDNYNIANTPWGQKGRGTFSELVTAFRKEGLKVGAYICPSLWNNDNYWAPNALTALGPVCRPNYLPSENSTIWNKFTSYLHGMVEELVEQFQPDAFWFDCSNQPPYTDTHLEAVLDTIRNGNPNATINIRGGTYSDYSETQDQSESLAQTILGTSKEFAGDYFEIPSVLQSSRQWAYDPNSSQKPTAQVIANLMMLTAKNGNYLMNVAPSPDGTWPVTAERSLLELANWFEINGEAIQNTRPVYPYEYDDLFVTSSISTNAYYVLIPAYQPNHEGTMSAIPTGSATLPTGASEYTNLFSRIKSGQQKNLTLPWMRPSLLKSSISKVDLLGASASISYAVTDAAGMVIQGISQAYPATQFSCKVFGCTCDGMGNYYGVGPFPGCNSFGCAPTPARDWWVKTMDCQSSSYANTTDHPGCSDKKCEAAIPPNPVPPSENGLVVKITFE